MKKIIFIDLDGTFFNDEREPTKANIKALQHAKAKGHEIVFTTGRSYPFIASVNKLCGNISRFAISGTGSIIYDMQENKIIKQTPIPKSAVEAICKLDSPEIIWFFHCADGAYSNFANFPFQHETAKHFTEPVSEFVKTKTICQMWLGGKDFDLVKDLATDIEKVPDVYISNRHKALLDVSYPRRNLAFYDILLKGISKGSGIKTLCDMLNIPKENRIAIGDDMNDLSMFTEVGTSVAMENALPEVKKAATHLTDTNNNDGVAKFLNKFL